jgi:predicted HicB family RNase H-like nuclease
MKKNIDYYLNLPYTIEVVPIPDHEGGGYLAQLPELGKFAIIGDGDTPEEAISDLNNLKKKRFRYYLEEGIKIPEPKVEQEEFSGKFVLRLPTELHRMLAYSAKENLTSLNSYIVFLLSSNLQTDKTQKQFAAIIDSMDVMSNIMWNIDSENPLETTNQNLDTVTEGGEISPPSDFSKFKKAA